MNAIRSGVVARPGGAKFDTIPMDLRPSLGFPPTHNGKIISFVAPTSTVPSSTRMFLLNKGNCACFYVYLYMCDTSHSARNDTKKRRLFIFRAAGIVDGVETRQSFGHSGTEDYLTCSRRFQHLTLCFTLDFRPICVLSFIFVYFVVSLSTRSIVELHLLSPF